WSGLVFPSLVWSGLVSPSLELKEEQSLHLETAGYHVPPASPARQAARGWGRGRARRRDHAALRAPCGGGHPEGGHQPLGAPGATGPATRQGADCSGPHGVGTALQPQSHPREGCPHTLMTFLCTV
ncbi:hypothetical protein CRUP_013481, partial [Coryphaenoides rupestris]